MPKYPRAVMGNGTEGRYFLVFLDTRGERRGRNWISAEGAAPPTLNFLSSQIHTHTGIRLRN
jgi:hypothetical protein